MTAGEPGPRRITVRLGPLSRRIPVRGLVVCGVCLLIALGTGWLALMLGEPQYAPARVWAALTGEASRSTVTIVTELRLPRVVAGIVFGAMLGVSGAIFQTLTRNVLGSPDIIGFTTGAYTGGLVTIILIGSGFAAVASGALVGGLATATVVFLLSRHGGAQGFRLIIVGIGLTAMLASIDSFLILTADLDTAMVAATWGAGSLNGVDWPHVGPAVLTGLVLLGLGGLLAHPLAQLDLGDDQAAAIGTRIDHTRLAALALGVALVAVVTSVIGPIAFVALAAPQIARRLAGSTGTPLAPAAAVGATVLPVADVLAQHAAGGLPVGVLTISLGGVYLLFLIISEHRRGAV